MFHGLDGGFGAFSTAVATLQHFAKMGKMQDEGVCYGSRAGFRRRQSISRERQNTVIYGYCDEDSAHRYTDDDEPAGRRDIFNAPLTVRSEVPADWTYAKVTQGGFCTGAGACNGERPLLYLL